MVIKGLQETLQRLIFAKYDEIPALRMLRMSSDEIRARAEKLRERVPAVEIIEGLSIAGLANLLAVTDLRLARVVGPFRRFNLAHPKLLILRGGGFGLSFI